MEHGPVTRLLRRDGCRLHMIDDRGRRNGLLLLHLLDGRRLGVIDRDRCIPGVGGGGASEEKKRSGGEETHRVAHT